jgi:hypothetical protein
MEQNEIEWNLQNFVFWKNRIDYNKLSVSTQNNWIIIITDSVKQPEAQIGFYIKIHNVAFS